MLCASFFCRKGGLQDGVGVAMVGNHDVIIAATISNAEATSVISVDLAHMFDMDVQFVRHDGG